MIRETLKDTCHGEIAVINSTDRHLNGNELTARRTKKQAN
jgi:hypothetical protein